MVADAIFGYKTAVSNRSRPDYAAKLIWFVIGVGVEPISCGNFGEVSLGWFSSFTLWL